MKSSIFVFFIVCFLQFTVHCFAEAVIKIDSDKQFSFAEHYFSNGEYLKAIDEYERFIYFFPEEERVELARFRIGMSYFESKNFKKAINTFTSIIDKHNEFQASNIKHQTSNIQHPTSSYFMISECYLRLNAPGPAISILHNLITIADDSDVRDEAYYRAGWLCLEMASWEKARSYFGKISPENKNKYQLEKLSDELDKKNSIHRKSPQLAGYLSVIPGAGYLYCGRYRDAATAFLLNGALMYAAYKSFDNENYALGGIITLVEMGFYTGSIYGSVNSVRKYNRNNTRRFIENLKENTKISLSAGSKKDGIFLCFRYVF